MRVVSCPCGRFTPIVCGHGKHCVKETASENCCGFYSDLVFSLWKRYLILFFREVEISSRHSDAIE